MDSSVDQTSLQLMTDDLLCGRLVYSIDKKYHPLLVPYLQKAKNEALANGDQGTELKINRIMNLLTLTSPKKTPIKKQQLTPRRAKTSPNLSTKSPSLSARSQNLSTKSSSQKDYSQYDNEVEQLMKNKKKFDEIESKNYTPIQMCIQQHRDEASETRNYQDAKKYHNEYLSFSNYIRSLPKRHRHYGEEEYIDNLKYKYYLAIQYYQDLEERLNNESDQLDQSEQQITMDTISAMQEKDDEFDQEEKDILSCKNFHPSSSLLNLRKTEKKCAKQFRYDEAEMRLKYSIELENQEKNEYIEQKRYELAQKKLRTKIEQQKQNELTKDQTNLKGELFEIKRKRLLRIAQAEIDAIKEKIEELGDQAPDETELILYSSPPIHNSPKKTKSSIKFSQSYKSYKSDSNLSNQELRTPTEGSIADSTSQQNLKSSNNTNTIANVDLSSDESTSINFDEENMQGLRRNFNSSKAVLVGTPNSRSIADLKMTKKDNQNYDSDHHQHNINRDKSNDYEFVFEDNEEEENIKNEIPINKSQIDSNQKSILKNSKGKTNVSRSIILNNNEDDDSIFLSVEIDFQSDEGSNKRKTLSYENFLTKNQDSGKKTRERLKYDMYLRSPKPSYITTTEIQSDNYSYTSNNTYYSSEKIYESSEKIDEKSEKIDESSVTEIVYSSHSGKSNSNYLSEYYNYYSDEEEEEEEEIKDSEIENVEYSYNYITEYGLESFG